MRPASVYTRWTPHPQASPCSRVPLESWHFGILKATKPFFSSSSFHKLSVCSRAGLSNTMATSHMWLFKYMMLPYWTDMGYCHHHRKFLWAAQFGNILPHTQAWLIPTHPSSLSLNIRCPQRSFLIPHSKSRATVFFLIEPAIFLFSSYNCLQSYSSLCGSLMFVSSIKV